MSLLSAVKKEANKTNTEGVIRNRNELLDKIFDLTERLQVFSWGLQNYFIDVYLTSDSSRSLEQMNYKNRKYRANADLDELQEEIQAFRKENGENNEDINNASDNLDSVVKSFNESCTIVDGTYILQRAARDLKSFKYVDAVVELKNLHKRLDPLQFQGNLGTALRSFRTISDSQLAVSQGQLSVEFSNLFRWNFNSALHSLTYSISVQQNDPILLERVLRALYIADQMIIEIQPFSHFFIASLVPNIIKYNCEIFTEDHVGALVFNIKIDLNDPRQPSIPTIFNNLTAVFEFLETTMGAKLEAEKTFFEYFGDCNREAFFHKIIHDCIKSDLPHCEISHQNYKEIALELETFNKLLVDLKYVQAEMSPLKSYIEHTDLLLYETKCKDMLAEVIELMREYLSQDMAIVGSESEAPEAYVDVTSRSFKYDLNTPLLFPKCVISQNVKKIVTIVTKYLEECAHLPAEYMNQLVPYVKDVAVMYPNLVMYKNEARLQSLVLETGLFFNNCQYLAHSLIGPPWKNILPKRIADYLNTTLMSYIYDLRLSGIEKLSIYLKQTREIICNKVAGDLRDWSMEAFDAFNQDVNYVLAIFTEIRNSWCNVLPVIMFERAVCTLVESFSEIMLRRVLRQVDDITEDVVGLLASRFQYTIDEIEDMYPNVLTLDKRLKYWEKLKLIPKLFTAQLFEISRMWNEYNNVKNKYTYEEVRLIIKMRFPDDDYRLRTLKKIQ